MRTAIYMRVSTNLQDISLQKRAITAFLQYKDISDAREYIDEDKSGKNTDRPALKQLLKDCNEGAIDLLVVYKFDRLSRSLQDLLELISTLNALNVSFASVTEQVDLSNPYGKMQMQMLGVFAEFEREMIRARTKAGMAVLKSQGKHMGRRSKLTIDQLSNIQALYNSGATITNISKETKLSYNTIKRLVKGTSALSGPHIVKQ